MRFASSMFDRYRQSLSSIEDFNSLERWMEEVSVEKQFLEFAAREDGLKPLAGEWEKSRQYMLPSVKALVGRYSRLDDEAFYRFYLPIDETISTAMENSFEIL